MATLLNNNGSDGGFRLRSLEIFNWGTFHAKVYKVQPDGRTSLLTGANGSGKTTLIDALLTLLVPSNKRFYNQSSGAEFKKERDENSYFWGYYGKTFSDMEERSSIEQLRSKSDNPYSVLLASFQNSSTKQTVTLAQVRWFANGAIKKVYLVSPYQLNINDHFGKGSFDVKGEWKRKLQKQFPKTDLFDSFKDYSARFSDLFGLKEKALPLFNQTVGIKVLGDLTLFVRQQMLEEPNSEEQFKALHNHYTDLLISHKAIKKDEKQLDLLSPIIDNKTKLRELKQELSMLDAIKEQLPFFFNRAEYDLLDAYLINLGGEISRVKLAKAEVERDVRQLEEQHNQLISQKAQIDVDSQVQLLKKDIQNETEKRDSKKTYFDEYRQLARNLGLQSDVDESSFKENFGAATSLQLHLESEYGILTDEKAHCKIEKDAVGKQIYEVQEEISSLLDRENRIPRELILVRKKLLELLEAPEGELPFVGELIKVNEDSRHWEDVIERVLHSFSMRLLVPERHIKQVNHFVHTNNLRAKLVYERLERRPSYGTVRWPTDEDALINKIEIKQLDTYSKWIEQQLFDRFNYHCTDDLEVFYGSSKAVTSNGLIRNINRHEKDDRAQSWNKSKYRLGWDNKESIQYLQDQKQQLEGNLNGLNKRLHELQPQIEQITQKQPLVVLFTSKKSFSEIDWGKHAERIQVLSKQIDDLTSSNDKYQTILKQLREVVDNLLAKKEENEKLVGEVATSEKDHSLKTKQKAGISLDGLTEKGKALVNQFLSDESLDCRTAIDLEQFESFKKVCLEVLDKKLQGLSKKVNKKEIETVGDIGSSFIRMQKFWVNFRIGVVIL